LVPLSFSVADREESGVIEKISQARGITPMDVICRLGE
jgi:hypothetical protein